MKNVTQSLKNKGFILSFEDQEECILESVKTDEGHLHHEKLDKTFGDFSNVYKYLLGVNGRNIFKDRGSWIWNSVMQILNSCPINEGDGVHGMTYEWLKASFLQEIAKIIADPDYVDTHELKKSYLDLISKRDGVCYFTFSNADFNNALITDSGLSLEELLSKLDEDDLDNLICTSVKIEENYLDKIMKSVPDLSFEDIGDAIYDYCIDHINHFGCLPSDIAFNVDEDNEVLIDLEHYPIFLTKERLAEVYNLL